MTISVRESGTSLTISCSGQISLWTCQSNHAFPQEIAWGNIKLYCGACGSFAYSDRNAIVCQRCGLLTSSAVVGSLSESIVSWVLEHAGLRADDPYARDFAQSSQERANLTSAIFSVIQQPPQMQAPPLFPSQVPTPFPVPPGRPVPKMDQPFDKPIREGANGEYEVLGLLAKGGFSRIFLARLSNGALVVIKKPWGYRNQQEKGVEGRINPFGIAVEKIGIEGGFLRAAKDKMGVVGFVDLYHEAESPCLVMRFADGPNLRKHVTSKKGSKQGGGLDVNEGIDIFEQILSVIQFIHNETNMVHRDITPNNVIIENGQVVMIDFGTISQHSEIEEEIYTGIQAGGYHAPEQAQGASSKVCDVYSLGSTLYFLLTGKDPPSPSLKNPTEKVMIHELRRVGAPEELISIIMKSRALSPAARFASVNELKNAVLAYKDPGWEMCGICQSPMQISLIVCGSCGAIRCNMCGRYSKRDQPVCSCGAEFCPFCSFPNAAESAYCGFCGQSLRNRALCENCNQEISISAIFCKHCGMKTFAPAT